MHIHPVPGEKEHIIVNLKYKSAGQAHKQFPEQCHGKIQGTGPGHSSGRRTRRHQGCEQEGHAGPDPCRNIAAGKYRIHTQHSAHPGKDQQPYGCICKQPVQHTL